MARIRLGFTQSELEEKKRQALAAGATEEQVEAHLAQEENKRKASRQATQKQEKRETGKENLFTKATRLLAGPTTATTLDIAGPGKGAAEERIALKEEMLQESRSLISQAIQETDPAKKEKLLERSRQLDATAPELTKQQSRVLGAERGQRNLAIAGETAPAALAAVPGVGPVLAGALGGGAQGATALLDEGQGMETRIGRGLLGAGIGAATAFVIGKGLDKLKKIGQPKGVKITGSKISKDPFFASTKEALEKEAADIGITRTTPSLEKTKLVEDAFGGFQKSIDDLLQGSEPITDDIINKNLEKHFTNSNISLDTPANKRLMDNVLQKLNTASGDNIALNQIKSVARGEMGNAFKKGGSNLTAKEEIWSVAYKTIKESLDGVSPDIRVLNNRQNSLFNLSKEFAVAATKAGQQVAIRPPLSSGAEIPLGITREGFQRGVTAPGRGVGAVAGKIGALNEAIGGALTPGALQASPLAQSAADKGLESILGGQAGRAAAVPSQKTGTPPPLLPQKVQQQIEEATGTSNITSEQMQQVELSNVKESTKKKIRAAFKLQQDSLGDPKTQAKKETADRVLTQLEDLYFASELGGESRLAGILPSVKAAAGTSPTTATYLKTRDSSKAQLARALGEVGNLAKNEQEDAIKLLAGRFSTREEAIAGFKQMRIKLGLPERF